MSRGMVHTSTEPLTPNLDPAKLQEIVGYRLRRARVEKNLTQEELALHVGISRASIANIERGHQTITVYVLYKLATQLGTSLSVFFPEDVANPVGPLKLELPPHTPTDVCQWITKEAGKA